MSDCFANVFVRIFSSTVSQHPSLHQLSPRIIQERTITVEIIKIAISTLNPKSAGGDDEIHPRMLIALSNYLSLPFNINLDSSLRSGTLSIGWLSSLVIPIYEKSHRYDPLNYRLISLTSVPCKIMEKLIVQNINAYLNEINLLTTEEF